MAAAAMGIFNHAMAAQAMTGKSATPMDSSTTNTSGTDGTSGSDDTSSNSATISANDFLTLLVTEMQNQDPTADTDPNEYINQLVQVNSLEQLIDINQTLSTTLGGTSSTTGNGSATGQNAAVNTTPASAASSTAVPQAAQGLSAMHVREPSVAASRVETTTNLASQRVPGNLSVPQTNEAAQRVGHALSGRTRAQAAIGNVSSVQ